MAKAQQIEYKGQSKTFLEWSKELGIHESVLRQRINVSCWNIHDAFTIPPEKKNRNACKYYKQKIRKKVYKKPPPIEDEAPWEIDFTELITEDEC